MAHLEEVSGYPDHLHGVPENVVLDHPLILSTGSRIPGRPRDFGDALSVCIDLAT